MECSFLSDYDAKHSKCFVEVTPTLIKVEGRGHTHSIPED